MGRLQHLLQEPPSYHPMFYSKTIVPDLSLLFLSYPLPISFLSLSYLFPISFLSLSYPFPIPFLSLSYPFPIPFLSLSYPFPIPFLSPPIPSYPFPIPFFPFLSPPFSFPSLHTDTFRKSIPSNRSSPAEPRGPSKAWSRTRLNSLKRDYNWWTSRRQHRETRCCWSTTSPGPRACLHYTWDVLHLSSETQSRPQ